MFPPFIYQVINYMLNIEPATEIKVSMNSLCVHSHYEHYTLCAHPGVWFMSFYILKRIPLQQS